MDPRDAGLEGRRSKAPGGRARNYPSVIDWNRADCRRDAAAMSSFA
jgi:hypothetical protein